MANPSPGWDAVVLLQLGGPERLEDIEPFLANLLSDPEVIQLPRIIRPFQGALGRLIARKRVHLVRPRYERIGDGRGGASPILRHTKAQADALAARLGIPVHLAMRCSPPRADETARAIKAGAARRVLVLPLYPHWSGSTTGSALKDFAGACKRQGVEAELHFVRSWGSHPAYVALLAAMCKEAVAGSPGAHLLLSAHSLPEKYIRNGDPYRKEVEATLELLRTKLDGTFTSVELGFQSRVGPVKWIGPTTDERVAALAAGKAVEVALCPLGFVSDHIETLYDLDVVYRGQIEAHGMKAHRVAAFNDDPRFILLLEELARGPTEALEARAWTK
jgi:protoporphyrin/coproporphyrin ferrochelatase